MCFQAPPVSSVSDSAPHVFDILVLLYVVFMLSVVLSSIQFLSSLCLHLGPHHIINADTVHVTIVVISIVCLMVFASGGEHQ